MNVLYADSGTSCMGLIEMENKFTKDKIAMEKITLSVPEEIFKDLNSLSDFYNQDVNQTIISILNAISVESGWIINLAKEKKRSVIFDRILNEFLRAGVYSAHFFEKIPQELGGEGLFVLEDFDFSFVEDHLWFNYAATQESNLWITSFEFARNHCDNTITCNFYVDVEKAGAESLEKLECEAANYFEELDPEHYSYEVNEDSISIQYTASSIEDFPILKQISKIIKEICAGAGIKE